MTLPRDFDHESTPHDEPPGEPPRGSVNMAATALLVVAYLILAVGGPLAVQHCQQIFKDFDVPIPALTQWLIRIDPAVWGLGGLIMISVVVYKDFLVREPRHRRDINLWLFILWIALLVMLGLGLGIPTLRLITSVTR